LFTQTKIHKMTPYCIIFGAYSYKTGNLFCIPWNRKVFKILQKLPWDNLVDRCDEEVKLHLQHHTRNEYRLLKGSNKGFGDTNEFDFTLLRNNFKDADGCIPDIKEFLSIDDLNLPSNYLDIFHFPTPRNTIFKINLVHDFEKKHYSDIRESHLASDFIRWYLCVSNEEEED